MDRDGRREVTLSEFRYYLTKHGLGEATSRAPAATSQKKDNDSTFDYNQRRPSWQHLPLKIAGFDRDAIMTRLWAQAALYFREADRNGDGSLTHTEIRSWLRENLDTKRRFGVKESGGATVETNATVAAFQPALSHSPNINITQFWIVPSPRDLLHDIIFQTFQSS